MGDAALELAGNGSLGGLLRTWRERAMLTQEQLASRTGLGVRTIRRLESLGARRPRNGSVLLLATALALSEEERAQLLAAARGDDGPAARPGRVPRQLPADVPGFTGRADHLREMDDLLRRDDQPTTMVISAIAGTAGVGKTALAVHWAHRVADRFPDGQLYVNLRGFDPGGTSVEPAAAIRGFLDALEVPPHRVPAGLDAQAALYRSLLADRRVLVVLDNARDSAQVRPLLPGAPGCLAVVTSRRQLTGLLAAEGASPLTLDLLSTVEAREFLARRLGEKRVAGEPDAVDEIVVSCARLPLALAVAAARAVTRPELALADLVDEMRAERRRLDAFHTGDPVTDVRAVFTWSYQRLGTGAARLFRLLGLHAGPEVSGPAAASLAGVPPREAAAGLAELADAHLLTVPAAGRYACHDLLRAYAVELTHTLDSEADRAEATGRGLDHYLHTGYAAAMLLYPHRQPIDLDPLSPGVTTEPLVDSDHALTWFGVEHQVLVATIQQAAETGHHRHSWRLAWTLPTFLERQGHLLDLVVTQQAALVAATHLGNQQWIASAHRGLGRAYVMLGRYDEALTQYQSALGLGETLGDPLGRAHCHVNIAFVLEQQTRLREAIGHGHRAYALYHEVGHAAGEADALNSVGWFHALLGDHEEALGHCRRALARHEEIGNRHGQANAWHSLGYAHHGLGRYPRAEECYQRAYELYAADGDRYYEAATLEYLGDTHRAAGRPAEARRTWQRALDIFHQLDHPDADQLRAKIREP